MVGDLFTITSILLYSPVVERGCSVCSTKTYIIHTIRSEKNHVNCSFFALCLTPSRSTHSYHINQWDAIECMKDSKTSLTIHVLNNFNLLYCHYLLW